MKSLVSAAFFCLLFLSLGSCFSSFEPREKYYQIHDISAGSSDSIDVLIIGDAHPSFKDPYFMQEKLDFSSAENLYGKDLNQIQNESIRFVAQHLLETKEMRSQQIEGILSNHLVMDSRPGIVLLEGISFLRGGMVNNDLERYLSASILPRIDRSRENIQFEGWDARLIFSLEKLYYPKSKELDEALIYSSVSKLCYGIRNYVAAKKIDESLKERHGDSVVIVFMGIHHALAPDFKAELRRRNINFAIYTGHIGDYLYSKKKEFDADLEADIELLLKESESGITRIDLDTMVFQDEVKPTLSSLNKAQNRQDSFGSIEVEFFSKHIDAIKAYLVRHGIIR